MSALRYCRQCVLPDTRPGIEIGSDGICTGCRNHARKGTDIDWHQRRDQLDQLIDAARRRATSRGAAYDCIVPVSGGKDSTWQVVKCLEFGLKVLAVTWRTPGRTEIGQRNLDNLIGLGVDHFDVSISPRVERLFTYKTLATTGSSAVPMHLAICVTPLRLAVALDVSLVVWGESPFMEYGGDPGESELNKLNHAWLRRHGILQGRSAADWIDDELSARDLAPYMLPAESEFAAREIESIFLGYYLPWDPIESLAVARRHGFEVRPDGAKLGLYDFADIDCDFISVHHWFKWLKFGFTRLFDNLALEIRNGRISRAQASDIIRATGDQRPVADIDRLCRFLEITDGHFAEIEERFRNRNIWTRRDGLWRLDGFLIDDWDWGPKAAARPMSVAS